MNNKIITWGAVSIIVLGGLWYLFSNTIGENDGQLQNATTTASVSSSTQQTTTKTPASRTTGTNTSQKAAPSVQTSGIGTLPYLFSLKQSLVCTVKINAYTKRSGTIYVAGGKMRGNFTSTINGILTNTSMIDDGEYLYAWTSGASKGLKLPAASGVSGSAIANNGGFDLANDLSFACNPWTVNASVFTPPASISFSNTL